ncbi:GntP family permease [Flagellimonas algicola]|uniref:Gluconate transporter n=1 Tax=Flagellimonas algicola TaxID=2583815 RepID=A0ABY2WQN6_9FLAO|nr:SLC13 family permease [Allomuricauda algicola]TMU57317.1 gluconate transporter [Allomuricauda algicola]
MTSLAILIGCIVLLIVSITILKVHPIPALLIAGLILGLVSGGSVEVVTESLLSGFGNTLKWIGLVILFGTLLGEILAATGGADVIAESVIKVFGIRRLPMAMAIIGFLVGIPVFVDVAYLTLLPTVIALSKKSGHSVLVLGLSLASSLTVAHALIPPTPGPLAVAAILETDISGMIPINVTVGLFAVIGGLIWVKFNKKNLTIPLVEEVVHIKDGKNPIQGFKRVLPFISLLAPLVLMGLGNLFSGDNQIIAFIKNPVWALLIGVVFALPLLERKGFSKKINEYFKTSGAKSATVILITGTGGAFGQVIKDTEIVNSLLPDTGGLETIGIMLPFLLSFMFTTVTGSITVSLITTASIMAPMVTNGSVPPELTAAAIGAGSLGIIHVNSSFFWLFKEVHGIDTHKLLKTFSVLTAVIAFSGVLMALLLYFLM